MAIKTEGAISAHVTDLTKLVCPFCGGPELMLTSVMDDQGDIYTSANKDWDISNGDGSDIQCLVALCTGCGVEWIGSGPQAKDHEEPVK